MDFEQKYQKDPGMNRVKKLNFHLLSLRQVSTRPYCAQKGFLDKLNGQLPGRVENATKGRGLLLFYRKE